MVFAMARASMRDGRCLPIYAPRHTQRPQIYSRHFSFQAAEAMPSLFHGREKTARAVVMRPRGHASDSYFIFLGETELRYHDD